MSREEQPLFENFFENFVHSFAAARLLLQRAHENEYLIEGTILYATLADALLRNLTALRTGKRDRDGRITLNPRFFAQEGSPFYSEREIFRLARENDVIDEEVFRELGELYDFRNRVVHRFVITEVTYAEMTSYLDRYERIYSKLHSQLKEIEQPAALSSEESKAAWKKILRKVSGDSSEEI